VCPSAHLVDDMCSLLTGQEIELNILVTERDSKRIEDAQLIRRTRWGNAMLEKEIGEGCQVVQPGKLNVILKQDSL